ncbi:NAD(P)H-binding protein [Flavobacterium sp. SUN046]|uniref:NAD(P)H-binding protein n=1 Tax=Flavobacterium sp. SUN046 TaxID=3002440 RepID=UPI002DB58AFD|nr:NAD(P)H-binding protein [Flavobacterium sp. SUN046]MEC4048214.1 NAD(P)H-binding protein [Flavobacterium sp. SUN046]
MKTISLLGCGWLGLPLAKQLMEKGYTVKGTTTTEDKITVLERAGVVPYLLVLSEDSALIDFVALEAFLADSNCLIIAIPPKLRGAVKENFVLKIKNIIPSIEQSSIKNILFVSSTAVYKDTIHFEEWTTVDSLAEPDTENGKQLLEVELLLQNVLSITTTIVRMGGLIGEDRHPVKFLAGKKGIENPDAPVNLIHQNEAVALLISIIEQGEWGKTINGVAPYHPTRKVYYTEKALAMGLPIPEFNEEGISVGKRILGSVL